MPGDVTFKKYNKDNYIIDLRQYNRPLESTMNELVHASVVEELKMPVSRHLEHVGLSDTATWQLDNMWFQENGSTPHFTNETI